jgi:hypothetical protein
VRFKSRLAILRHIIFQSLLKFSPHLSINLRHVLILKRLLLTPFSWLAAILFLIEEALWDALSAWMARLAAWEFIHRLEQRICQLPPRWALCTFLLPSFILIPAKLLGLHAIANGHWILGSGIFVLAKLAGMALFSRIFNLTRPALMQLPWFVRVYQTVMRYRNRIHDYLAHWQAYQALKQHIRQLVARVKNLGDFFHAKK